MADHIAPALTLEEWAGRETAVGREYLGWYVKGENGELGENGWEYSKTPAQRHAHAAFLLHGQPFGFTREDANAVRTAYQANVVTRDMQRALQRVVERIEALLPPEPSNG